ncbi:HAD-IB family hydrolase [Brachybacterium aquaticum]|uniref:HAD superfamily hydrolase (TIGR01490 family) n=1 Tax=Brachybacterium aquaticum TaxID=1432564 RepID=A0A841AAQ3_9MICO|nr:HAD-IB family hydrolase [Brachybacterium aquaticum]MBB5830310.1 HAD superfamily hydrolase (TIGR01490 family) [Brachybacterium aquaticum]
MTHSTSPVEPTATAGGSDHGGRRILLTGVTGFLGQAVLRSLLETTEDVRVLAVVRPKGSVTGRKRLEQLLRKPVFASWAEEISKGSGAEGADPVDGKAVVKSLFDERVEVLEGDLTDMPEITVPLDTVIHSASSVSFDPPIDEAFRTNVGGARNLYEALLASGQDPHVIHVSTAYVGGISKGLRREGSLKADVDWRAEYEAALSARERVEAESRKPETLRSQIRAAKLRDGRMGPKAVAASSEEARRAWVDERLVDFGRTRAQSVGWTDIYTFTKAMAEQVAEELWAGNGHRVSFVRPSIIESAMKKPYPGWIDGYKVADPLIMAYARGMLPEFPGLADSILDVIPVDHVVNVIVALATQETTRRGEDAYFQVVSGASNPLPFHEMVSAVREYFVAHPLEDDKGNPISVPEWSFPAVEMVEQRFRAKELSAKVGAAAVAYLPATRRTRQWTSNLHKATSGLTTLRKYIELYRQYTKTEMVFDDANTRALREELPADFLETHDFDVTHISWREYFQEQHLPAVTDLTKAYSRAKSAQKRRAARPAPQLAERADALAVFDLDGTVLATNIVQQYFAVVRATKPRRTWPAELSGLLAAVPGYLRAEKRDRSELIRLVNRRYKGYRSDDLRRLMQGEAGRRIRASIRPEALETIERHRAAGHRTVLVTGALDVLVEPLQDLFDEVIATHMDEDASGQMTGYLATPPLVDEARGNWLLKYADEHGADLSASYGYGDSHADAAWLALVGTPAAVSPDLGLYAVAKKKRWQILEW